jgi:hypothetical protein
LDSLLSGTEDTASNKDEDKDRDEDNEGNLAPSGPVVVEPDVSGTRGNVQGDGTRAVVRVNFKSGIVIGEDRRVDDDVTNVFRSDISGISRGRGSI